MAVPIYTNDGLSSDSTLRLHQRPFRTCRLAWLNDTVNAGSQVERLTCEDCRLHVIFDSACIVSCSYASVAYPKLQLSQTSPRKAGLVLCAETACNCCDGPCCGRRCLLQALST